MIGVPGAQSAMKVLLSSLGATWTSSKPAWGQESLDHADLFGAGDTKTFHRDGVRAGERTGTRDGSRLGTREGSRTGDRDGTRTGTGTQAGVQTGSLGDDLDVDARKSNQYTGFILKGWKGQPSYTATGAPVWNSPSYGNWKFGDWSFGEYGFNGGYKFGDYTFEPVSGAEWGAWDAAPGENPDDCLRSANADKITQISNVITDGAITDGPITDGDVTDGDITTGDITEGATAAGASTAGDVTPSGTAKVFVNNKGPLTQALQHPPAHPAGGCTHFPGDNQHTSSFGQQPQNRHWSPGKRRAASPLGKIQ